MATEYIASFTPQAWINDYAVRVADEGRNEWVTQFEGLSEDQREAILATGHDTDDLLKEDPAAPLWVLEWDGPFEIHVRKEEK